MSQAPLLIDTQWDTRGLAGNCSSNYLYLSLSFYCVYVCVRVCMSVFVHNPLVSCVVLISQETELISDWEKAEGVSELEGEGWGLCTVRVSLTPSFNNERAKLIHSVGRVDYKLTRATMEPALPSHILNRWPSFYLAQSFDGRLLIEKKKFPQKNWKRPKEEKKLFDKQINTFPD